MNRVLIAKINAFDEQTGKVILAKDTTLTFVHQSPATANLFHANGQIGDCEAKNLPNTLSQLTPTVREP